LSAKTTTALPTSFVTVSAPAPPSIVAKPVISMSSSRLVSPSSVTSASMSRLIMSSCGVFRRSWINS
jgi:hypothetical protein